MIKYYVIGLLGFLLLASGFWAQHQSLRTLQESLNTANAQVTLLNESYSALVERTGRIQALVEATSKVNQENRNDLQKALRGVPDRPTAPAVRDSLCKSLRCAP